MKAFEKLQKRIEEDYEKYAKELEKERFESGKNPTTFYMDKAYQIAHYNEIVDVLCDCCDSEEPPFGKDTIKKALKCEENLLDVVYDSWMDYSHPERYNFFCYEDTIDIIKYAFQHC